MSVLSAARFLPEAPSHDAVIDAIAAEAFGPGRFARAAERVREQAGIARDLSFVAEVRGEIVGSVRQSRILVGERPALLLGPLAVRPAFKGQGIGRALLGLAATAAAGAGEAAIILVGDPPYYQREGYRPLPKGSILMPGPVDPSRILGLALAPGALAGLAGAIRRRSAAADGRAAEPAGAAASARPASDAARRQAAPV